MQYKLLIIGERPAVVFPELTEAVAAARKRWPHLVIDRWRSFGSVGKRGKAIWPTGIARQQDDIGNQVATIVEQRSE